MLATLKEVLEIANQRETAIPHFNIDNIDGIEAVMEAADTENYPVILSIGQGAINAGNLWYLADAVQRAANDSKVPVVLHLDHGVSYEQTVVCLRAGFTSVMYDGSHHPFEENVRESLAVIRSAHAVGVSVECELGAIGGVEDGMSHDHLMWAKSSGSVLRWTAMPWQSVSATRTVFIKVRLTSTLTG